MRVGLLIYGGLETVSGGYLYNRQLVAYLQAQGDQVLLVSLPWRNYVAHLADNLSSHWFRVLRDLPVDILIQDELNHPSCAWLNDRLRSQVTYPIVSLVHLLHSSVPAPFWQRVMFRWVEARYLTRVHGLLYNSQHTRQTAAHLAHPRPLPAGCVAVPGRDHLEPLSAADLAQKNYQAVPLRLLFLGNVAARKGLHTVLLALRDLQQPCQLAIVGRLDVDAHYVRQCRALAALLPHNCQVTWHGKLAGEALRSQCRQAHALLLPSIAEAYGIAFVEAQAYGLPAIGCTGSGASEIIQHGKSGYLIAPNDSQALLVYLRAWAEQRALLRSMGHAARQHFEQQPTWAESCAKIRDFLQSDGLAR